ncbi:fasciclin domain-containing protein [Salinimicrobium oceani]|uniref:Fasciclin domain-containing protein n=1 Tax=Salinimicrobium oceani TaxID=2722702 RepID=A0ABX1CU91_9FLAO|nr:fasciclin domain-containing protein [Salinimicrobium oceani]NJW51859.1 fasciclin domain-containing protein [Salinimicrobium oceani]
MRIQKILMLFAVLFLAFSCKDNERDTESIEITEGVDENFDNRLEEARGDDDVVNAVESNPELSTFATGLNAWNVEDSIDTAEEDILIFAPTNIAYSTISQEEGQEMLALDSEEIIAYHILKTPKDLAELKAEIRNANDTLMVETMQGEDLKLSLDDDAVVLTGVTGISARVTDSVQAGNGTVYIIDKVLLPREFSKEVTITNEG